MRWPNVMLRKFWTSGSPPAPFAGSGKKRRPRREVEPSVKLRTGPLEGGRSAEALTSPSMTAGEPTPGQRRMSVAGKVLGGLAMLTVVQLWVWAGLGILGLSWWGESGWPLLLALTGVHLFGIPGAVMDRGDRKLGVIAVFGFWFSFAAALVLLMIVALVRMVFGG